MVFASSSAGLQAQLKLQAAKIQASDSDDVTYEEGQPHIIISYDFNISLYISMYSVLRTVKVNAR
jgi:hypothetical protein